MPVVSTSRLPALLAALLLSLPVLQLAAAAASASVLPAASMDSQQTEQLPVVLSKRTRFQVLSHSSQRDSASSSAAVLGEEQLPAFLPDGAWRALGAVAGWWQQVPAAMVAMLTADQQVDGELGSGPAEDAAVAHEENGEHMWKGLGSRALLGFGRKKGAINSVRVSSTA